MRITGEALLLSTLINLEDVAAAKRYGITEEHFLGFQDEYKWLQNYIEQYDKQPSRDMFRAAFPDFRLSDHDDLRSAVDNMLETYYRKKMVENIQAATDLLDVDVNAAYATLTQNPPQFTTSTPRSLVTDMTFFDDYLTHDFGIEVPMKTLQRNTGGIGKGQLWYLGARTGNGKSAYLCDWAAQAIRHGHRVKYYSLEMSDMEIRGRIHAVLANHFEYEGITSFGILHRQVDMKLYKQFVSEIDDRIDGVLHVHTPAEGFVTPGVIASTIDEYDLVIADHVGLVRPDGGGHSTDDWRVAARVSNAFKEMALATHTPIVAAAQINREGDHGRNPPAVKNLAGTDALGQDADVVVTMRAIARDQATVFDLPKNRNGHAKRKWWCRFNPDKGDFREITQEQADVLDMEAAEDE